LALDLRILTAGGEQRLPLAGGSPGIAQADLQHHDAPAAPQTQSGLAVPFRQRSRNRIIDVPGLKACAADRAAEAVGLQPDSGPRCHFGSGRLEADGHFLNAVQALDRLLKAMHTAQSEHAARVDDDLLHGSVDGDGPAQQPECDAPHLDPHSTFSSRR
jgi:hypothetical protein